MSSELSEREGKVLSHLKSLCGSSRRVEFNINDVSKALSMPVSEVEKALVSLMEKGLVNPVKIPLSEATLSYVKKKVFTLDGKYLTGEMELSKYTEEWRKIVDCISDPSVREKIPPLPLSSLNDMLRGLSNILGYMKKLSQEKERLRKEIYLRLLEEYNSDYSHSLELAYRYIESVNFLLGNYEKLIKERRKELEMIEVDERIRGVKRAEKDVKVKEIAKLKEEVRKVAEKVKGAGVRDVGSIQAELDELKRTLEKLQDEFELIQARAIIEEDEKLKARAKNLQERIQEIKDRISALEKQKMEIEGKKPEVLFSMAEELHKMALLSEENYRKTIEMKKLLDEIDKAVSTISSL